MVGLLFFLWAAARHQARPPRRTGCTDVDGLIRQPRRGSGRRRSGGQPQSDRPV